MSTNNSFDLQQFHDELLAGTRAAFQILQWQHSKETIYFYTMCLDADFSSIEVGIKTEEQLKEDVKSYKSIVERQEKMFDTEELRCFLRYDFPTKRLTPKSNRHFEQAHQMAKAFGKLFFADENLTMREDEMGNIAYVSQYSNTFDAILKTIHKVLQTLDAEGLFGTGDAREKVILEIMWFEGSMSTGLFHILAYPLEPQTEFNPAYVQAQYYKHLAEALDIRKKLFRTKED